MPAKKTVLRKKIGDDIKHKINNDPDFINSKRYLFSLSRFTETKSNAKGVPNKTIAHLLCIPIEEVELRYNKIVNSIRQSLKIDVD